MEVKKDFSSSNKVQNEKGVLFFNLQRNIDLPPSENEIQQKHLHQETNNEKGKNIISQNNNKTLFENDKNMLDNNKSLFEKNLSLFGDNKNKNNSLFGENKNNSPEKNIRIFGDNNNNTLFGENNNNLFEKNKSLFGENNNNTLFRENNNNLFGNNKSLFGENDNNTLFGENKINLFEKNKSLFKENKINLFDKNKSLFGDNNNNTLFGENKNNLFEKNKSLFGENNSNTLFKENKINLFEKNISLFGDNKNIIFDNKKSTLFGDSEKSYLDNCTTLFGDNTNKTGNNPIFVNNQNLFNDNNIEKNSKKNNNLFGNKIKNYEEDNNDYLLDKKSLFSNITNKFDKNERNSISDIEHDENNEDKNDEEENEKDLKIINERENKKENEEKEEEENEEGEDEDDLEKKVNEEYEEENNDESGEENGINIFKNILKGKEKWYCKKKNVPKPISRMRENKILKILEVKSNSEIISKLDLNGTMYFRYIDIKELTNGNFILLFENEFYYINSRTFKILNIDESLKKYFCGAFFSYLEEINEELIGLISNKFVLIAQINNKEAKFFQEIKIKANILKSFPFENLIVINEYIEEKEKKINILHFYTYDKNLKFQLKAKEEINFNNFSKDEEIGNYNLFNCITNIKKFKNGKTYLFTLNSIPYEENQNFDSQYMSFYERDCMLFLNIYLYENKELTEIYSKKYIKHFTYSDSFDESDFSDFLKIWYDENLFIDEKNNKIVFMCRDLSRLISVSIEEKKSKRKKLNNISFKSSFYDKKSNLWYCLAGNENLEQQVIRIFKLSGEIFYDIKNIYLPYYFDDILLTKKGYLLAIGKNIYTYYSFVHHLGRYAPNRIINTSLCLLNISI